MAEIEIQARQQLRFALALSTITIVYNLLEGGISTYFGLGDETVALFGFGLDSFVEVLSGLGIFHMVLRMRKSRVDERDSFERTALKITAISFYLLSIGLVVSVSLQVYFQASPHTTIVGVIVACLSIATMWILYRAKVNVGQKLQSDAILSDANCTKSCLMLSVALLLSSLLFEWLQISYLDSAGALYIAWYAFREGKESWEKSESSELRDSCCDI